MRFDTLAGWLAWQESLNPKQIDLGLERVRAVWDRLREEPQRFRVITVGGTNGKGSCVAILESILQAGAYRVGAYTSPHLLRYNERIRIGGREVGDAELMGAFERVDQARAAVPLTYFEFGTLAALVLFQDAGVEVVVLEVGLGGRLDAVNVLDPDVALLTSVGIDHVDWLGKDRESIGREKAGIFRAGRPAVCADPNPPRSVIGHVREIGASLYLLNRDFTYAQDTGGWCWTGLGRRRSALPHPALRGEIQLRNAAAVLTVLDLLGGEFPLGQEQIRRGLLSAVAPGRFQLVPGEVEYVLDVSHNPDGARVLADNLAAHRCPGRTLAVFAMLADKDVEGVAQALDGVVNTWYAAGLATARGLAAAQLAGRLQNAELRAAVEVCADVGAACTRAHRDAQPGDRILVCGSFHTVAEALRQRV